eukprot:scaffold876_cov68-Phaeocystis_antarctica.AAC.2
MSPTVLSTFRLSPRAARLSSSWKSRSPGGGCTVDVHGAWCVVHVHVHVHVHVCACACACTRQRAGEAEEGGASARGAT